MERSEEVHMNQRVLICLDIDVVFPVCKQLLVATECIPLLTVETHSLCVYALSSADLVWILLQALQVVVEVDSLVRRMLRFRRPL